jgi:NAD(P)H-nitrite reductase large subunit
VAAENHPLYNRMGITRLVYGRSAMQGLYLMPESWYAERKIEVLLNTTARSIDTAGKAVLLADGEALPFDRLILATGSRSFVPPLKGYGGSGCFVLRSANDAMGLRAHVQQHQSRYAVVAGGGLLGLEAAYALHKLGVKVTVVERNHWLLHRQLDERAGHLLQLYLNSLGLEVLLQANIQHLERDADGVQHVHLDVASPLRADVFVVAAGIAPNIDLAQAAGLQVARAVVVDAHMQTSCPGIYAAGDVAEYAGRNQGLWAVAVEQAEVAACNALGQVRDYREPVLSTVLKVVGADVVSVGRFEAAPGDEVFVDEDSTTHRYRKLVLRDGRLQGAILVGWPDWIEPLSKAVKAHTEISAHLEALKIGHWQPLLLALPELLKTPP